MKELMNIQQGLKVPKDKKGHDGKYYYRNCDSILEAVKPLLIIEGCQLVLSDSIIMLGNRFYVEAVAILTNEEGKTVHTKGMAREGDKLMSMSDSQITGSASSYARKTALSGMFLLDDSQHDPDGLKGSAEKMTPEQTVRLEEIKNHFLDNGDTAGTGNASFITTNMTVWSKDDAAQWIKVFTKDLKA